MLCRPQGCHSEHALWSDPPWLATDKETEALSGLAMCYRFMGKWTVGTSPRGRSPIGCLLKVQQLPSVWWGGKEQLMAFVPLPVEGPLRLSMGLRKSLKSRVARRK